MILVSHPSPPLPSPCQGVTPEFRLLSPQRGKAKGKNDLHRKVSFKRLKGRFSLLQTLHNAKRFPSSQRYYTAGFNPWLLSFQHTLESQGCSESQATVTELPASSADLSDPPATGAPQPKHDLSPPWTPPSDSTWGIWHTYKRQECPKGQQAV